MGMSIGMPPSPVDLRDLAKQGINVAGIGVEPADTQVHTFLCHEENTPLFEVLIPRQGRPYEELDKEIARQIAKAKQAGIDLRFQSEDWRTIKLQEFRSKPRGYLCEYKGSAQALQKWIAGEQVELATGSFQQLSPSHARTWGPPSFMGLGGELHTEPKYETKEGFEQYWKDSGRFASLTWLESPEFMKLR
jgi:hypothetical protein